MRPPALEEAQVEGGLQLRDPAGQGRFRAPRGACGSPEASVSGDEAEISESEQILVFHQRDGLSQCKVYRRECEPRIYRVLSTQTGANPMTILVTGEQR